MSKQSSKPTSRDLFKDLKEEARRILSTSMQGCRDHQLPSLFRCLKNWLSLGSAIYEYVLSL